MMLLENGNRLNKLKKNNEGLEVLRVSEGVHDERYQCNLVLRSVHFDGVLWFYCQLTWVGKTGFVNMV